MMLLVWCIKFHLQLQKKASMKDLQQGVDDRSFGRPRCEIRRLRWVERRLAHPLAVGGEHRPQHGAARSAGAGLGSGHRQFARGLAERARGSTAADARAACSTGFGGQRPVGDHICFQHHRHGALGNFGACARKLGACARLGQQRALGRLVGYGVCAGRHCTAW